MPCLNCKDIVADQCGYQALGHTVEEAIKNTIEHIEAAHSHALKEMRTRWTEQQIIEMIRAQIILGMDA